MGGLCSFAGTSLPATRIAPTLGASAGRWHLVTTRNFHVLPLLVLALVWSGCGSDDQDAAGGPGDSSTSLVEAGSPHLDGPGVDQPGLEAGAEGGVDVA